MSKFIKTDKFGNPYQVVGCKDLKDTGYPKGYVELGGKLYKLEPSKSNKEGTAMWIKVTQVKKAPKYNTM